MVITHIAATEEQKIGAMALRADLETWLARFQDVARNDSMNQRSIKEARYYEGKAEAYRYVTEFLARLAIEVK